jgi:hypothetical protein
VFKRKLSRASVAVIMIGLAIMGWTIGTVISATFVADLFESSVPLVVEGPSPVTELISATGPELG